MIRRYRCLCSKKSTGFGSSMAAVIRPFASSGVASGPFVLIERKPASQIARMRKPFDGPWSNCFFSHGEES